MAKRHRHLLGALDVARAKGRAKAYRLADGGGLYLWIPPSGVKAWQFRYRHDGKPQTATLGRFSDTQGLAWARAEADKARTRVERGDHLTRVKAVRRAHKAAAAGNTFSTVTDAWVKIEARRGSWLPSHRKQVRASITNHLGELDSLPVSEMTAAMAAPLLHRVERAAPDMAKKVRQRLRSILDFAVESGLIPANPVPAPRRRKKVEGQSHLPATLTKQGVGAILRAADRAEISKGVYRAHLLAAFTAQRIGEVVPAEWAEIDFATATWTIPRSRMKRRDPARGDHQVPIPPLLLSQLREWRRVDGDQAGFICATPRAEAPVTREAVEKCYRRTLNLTGKHSPHSWRSVFSTWARDAGKPGDIVEAQLDHVVGNKVAAAYDRAKRLSLRREIMAWYEEQLIAARDGAAIVALSRTGR